MNQAFFRTIRLAMFPALGVAACAYLTREERSKNLWSLEADQFQCGDTKPANRRLTEPHPSLQINGRQTSIFDFRRVHCLLGRATPPSNSDNNLTKEEVFQMFSPTFSIEDLMSYKFRAAAKAGEDGPNDFTDLRNLLWKYDINIYEGAWNLTEIAVRSAREPSEYLYHLWNDELFVRAAFRALLSTYLVCPSRRACKFTVGQETILKILEQHPELWAFVDQGLKMKQDFRDEAIRRNPQILREMRQK